METGGEGEWQKPKENCFAEPAPAARGTQGWVAIPPHLPPRFSSVFQNSLNTYGFQGSREGFRHPLHMAWLSQAHRSTNALEITHGCTCPELLSFLHQYQLPFALKAAFHFIPTCVPHPPDTASCASWFALRLYGTFSVLLFELNTSCLRITYVYL